MSDEIKNTDWNPEHLDHIAKTIKKFKDIEDKIQYVVKSGTVTLFKGQSSRGLASILGTDAANRIVDKVKVLILAELAEQKLKQEKFLAEEFHKLEVHLKDSKNSKL